MPTPVSVARQCLTEEAARVLDEAVSVARRRSHAQTTSLHTISALISLPSSPSLLRDSISRARSGALPTRLQFRALELCVGVSLDRVPSSKLAAGDSDFSPPVSNSLMAAIKRSQANQRRHPESFHLQQIHFNQQTASVLKVELKHFVLSILDDPTVSRVFAEAGFRSSDIKLAVIHPPLPAKFSRCPPIFLCNLPDSDLGRPSFTFPFAPLPNPGRTGFDLKVENNDNRKIGEILVKKFSGGRKNPLLVGAGAGEALRRFVESMESDKGKGGGFLASEMDGISVISVENEAKEFVGEGGGDREKMRVRFEEVGREIEGCLGPGMVVNFGEIKVLVNVNNVGGEDEEDDLGFLVAKITGLVEGFKEKVWLIGAVESYEMYMKFLGRFPSVENDWDLQLLPITSSKVSESFGAKSSLMGSFVPLGGFFSTPSDFKNPLGAMNQSIVRCHLCTAKYEQEVAAIMKTGSVISVSDQYSENLPSWLQMAELKTSKEMDAAKTKDDGITLHAKILGLQKKWNDICRLHHAQPFSKFEPQTVTQISISEGFRCVVDGKESSSNSSSRDSSLNENQRASPSLGICVDLQNRIPLNHSIPKPVTSKAENSNCQSKLLEEVCKNQQKGKESPWITPFPMPSLSQPSDHTSSLSVTSVTTDLGLGTIYVSSAREIDAQLVRDQKEHLQHFRGFNSSEYDAVSENTSRQVGQSSSCSGCPPGGQFDLRDYKSIKRALTEKVGWQDEAICTIAEVVSQWKGGYRRHCGSNARGDIWLSFLGPDKVGKKKIASILAETIFGSQENLVSVDLRSNDRDNSSNSIFESQDLNDYDVKFRGKTVVDYITMELRKKPHSVIFLENLDKADPLAQNSVSMAIRTGKFPDSHGREISMNNVIFVTTSTVACYKKFQSEKESSRFSEERILGARRWRIKIVIEHVAESASRSNEMNISVSEKVFSSASSANKRKLGWISDATEQDMNFEAKKRSNKPLKSFLDLNLPVEEMEENVSSSECHSDSISENSEPWLEEIFDQVDGKVDFKPFDFDALVEKIMKEISIQFLRVFGSDVLLEIENEVMVQIVAASWLSDRKRAMEDWVETVLGRGFTEARLNYQPGVKCVVKLLTCKGVFTEEQASSICLPARIEL